MPKYNLRYRFPVRNLCSMRLHDLFPYKHYCEYNSTLFKKKIRLHRGGCSMIHWLRAWFNKAWVTIHASLNSSYDISTSIHLEWIINKSTLQEDAIYCEYTPFFTSSKGQSIQAAVFTHRYNWLLITINYHSLMAHNQYLYLCQTVQHSSPSLQ